MTLVVTFPRHVEFVLPADVEGQEETIVWAWSVYVEYEL